MRVIYRVRIVAWAAAALLFAGLTATAKPPAWAQTLLAEDVTELGKGYMSVRLADTSDVHYGTDQRVRKVNRGGIRILTENGRSRAICLQPYNADTERVIAARAWLISADGKNTDSYAINDFRDLANRENGIFWPQSRYLVLSVSDKVDVKGALVWEFEVESQVSMVDLTWFFPDDMPTLLCALDVAPAPGGKVEWHASNGDVPLPVSGAAGALHWEETKRRPRSGGEHPSNFLPTIRSVAIRAVDAQGRGGVQSWPELAHAASDIMEPRIAAASVELRTKAAALTAGKTNRWDKIRALAEFAQKEITYLAVILDKDCLAGYRPHAADEVLKNRFGDCKDKTTLLIALLRAIGEDGKPVLVFSGNPIAVQPEWASPRFNHVITCVAADKDVPANWPVIDAGSLGHVVLFDPTNSFTPVGLLPQEDQGGYGLIVAAQSPGLVALPTSTSELRSDIRATIDDMGDLSVKMTRSATGNIAAEAHARRDVEGGDRYKAQLEGWLHDTVAHLEDLKWNETWSPEAARRELTMEFVARRYGRRTGSLMLVSPQVVSSRERMTPWKTFRDGVVPSRGETLKRTVRITLPPDCTIEELPDPWKGEAPQARASLTYRREGNDVIYESEITTTAAFLDKKSYEAQRAWSQKIEDADRRPIVVRFAAVAK